MIFKSIKWKCLICIQNSFDNFIKQINVQKFELQMARTLILTIFTII